MEIVLSIRMGGFLVNPIVVSKDISTKFGDGGIVFDEFLPSVHVVVVVVGFTVRAEPRLDSFGPVLVPVGRGVFFGPKSFGHCGFVKFVETFVESWVEGFKRGIVNGMGEFVNTD